MGENLVPEAVLRVPLPWISSILGQRLHRRSADQSSDESGTTKEEDETQKGTAAAGSILFLPHFFTLEN